MRTLVTVFLKEFFENLRDRRTLLSALLFGPLFGPLLFGTLVSRMLDQNLSDADSTLELTISGSANAPTLSAFLNADRLTLIRSELSEAAARLAVARGRTSLVLIIPADYPTRFRAGVPAPLLLVADSSDSKTRKYVDRVRTLLAGYGGQIAQMRLQVRGIDPLISLPVAIDEIDTATPMSRAVGILGFMTYFVLFAMLMGGLYLAIDTTAGERERGSLEALLTLPVPRFSLVGGKILATCGYMAISLGITLVAFVAVFRFVPLDKLGMSSNLDLASAVSLFLVCVPLIPLGAALMTFVASFTHSYREAQTYISLVLLIPTLPIAFASIYSLKAQTALMMVPSLSQHLLMTSVLKGERFSTPDFAISAGVCILLAAVLVMFIARRWRSEKMLG